MKPLYSQIISHYHVKTVSLYYGKLLSYYRCKSSLLESSIYPTNPTAIQGLSRSKLLSLESSIYPTNPIGIQGLQCIKVVYRKSAKVVKWRSAHPYRKILENAFPFFRKSLPTYLIKV